MQLEEMVSFLDFARDTGAMTPNAVHNWSAAISVIAHHLNADERTVEFVQEHAATIRERLLSSKRGISVQTIDAYLQRAAAAISHFLVWKESPAKWEKEMASKPRKRRRPRPTPPVPAEKSAPPGNEPATPASRPDFRNTVQIPTESGKTIRLEFPDSFLMSDVLRAVWALAVHARDFDPEAVLKNIGKPAAPREEPTLLSVRSGTS